MKFSTTTCSIRVRLDWGGREREKGRGSRVELAENKLILDQFYSTLFHFSSPSSVQMDHKLSNIFQSNSKYKVPWGNSWKWQINNSFIFSKRMPETLLDGFDFEIGMVSETLRLRCWRKRTRTYKLIWSGSSWWWVFQVTKLNWLQKSMFPPQPLCWEVEFPSQFSFHKLCNPVSLWPGIAMGDIWNRKVSVNRLSQTIAMIS